MSMYDARQELAVKSNTLAITSCAHRNDGPTAHLNHIQREPLGVDNSSREAR